MIVGGLMLVAGTAAVLTAGPLNPPAGPVTSTYKTLNEVEPRTPISSLPFVISQPGSYYLTGNLNLAGTTQDAITVNASNVTVDLNSFSISGGRSGVVVGSSVQSVTIENGGIRDVAASGITRTGNASNSSDMSVRAVSVSNAGDFGILVGRQAFVQDCDVRGARVGIAGGFASRFQNCTIGQSRIQGFEAEDGSIVERCTVLDTQGGPASGVGFRLGFGTVASECNAYNNTGVGFSLETNVLVRASTAFGSGSHGFTVTFAGSRIENCNANNNTGSGVLVDGANRFTIERSSITGNGGAGIVVQGASSIGRIDSNLISTPGGPAAISISAASNGGVITNNTLTGSRAVIIDGANFRITGNHVIVGAAPFSNSGGGAPPATNAIGPIVTAATIGAATNPFANTQ
jgi:hypothetical protein